MVDRIDDGPDGAGRIQRLVDMFRGAEDSPPSPQQQINPFQQAAQIVQKLSRTTPSGWSQASLKALAHAIKNALLHASEAARSFDVKNQFAIQQAIENMRGQLHQLVMALNPPAELFDNPELREILEMLKPPAPDHDTSSFARGTELKGKVKAEIAQQQISDAIDKASKSTKGLDAKMQAQAGGAHAFAHMSLMQLARLLKRKLRKKKAGQAVDEDGNPIPTGDADEVDASRELRELMELFCAKALDTMRSIREDVAPKWAPEQQPWLVQEADRQVYDILLATIPEELFQETEAYQEIQDLRAGQAVFTLRAAGKLTDAAARRK